MTLIDKYLLRRFIPPLVYCLVAFSMLVVIWDLFDHLGEIIKAKPSFLFICRYYLGILCPALEYLFPACLMLAAIYALWQLTRNNELIAMRASGISLYRVMLPFLFVGLSFTILSVVLMTTVTPQAAAWTAAFYAGGYVHEGRDIRENQPYYNSAGRRQWLIGRLNLDDSHRLRHVKVTIERKDGSRALDILASRAEWLDGQWWFSGVQEQKYDEQGNPVGGLTPKNPDKSKIRQVFFLNEKPSDFVNESKPWEYYTVREMLRYLRSHAGISDEAVAEKKFALQRRLAMPWACLIVTLFGIPAGSRGARQSPLTGVFIAIGFFLGFYALGQIGAYLGIKRIIWAWLGAWLSNIMFMIAGIYLLVKLR